MKFLICFCLVICGSQLSEGDHKRTESSIQYPGIDPWDLHIPENSWWEAIKSKKFHPDIWAFDWIKYKKDIPKNSSILLDYTVQYMEPQFLWWSWVLLFHDSVFLCDSTNNTQDASVTALVRELLGIPEGCPVFKGEKRNTSGSHFPFENKILLINRTAGVKTIRILTNLWEDDTSSAEKLFAATFRVDYDYSIKDKPINTTWLNFGKLKNDNTFLQF